MTVSSAFCLLHSYIIMLSFLSALNDSFVSDLYTLPDLAFLVTTFYFFGSLFLSFPPVFHSYLLISLS